MICPVFVARDVSGFRTARKGGGEWARQECCKGYGRCVSRDCSSGMSGTSCYREKRHLRRGRNSRRVIRSLIRSAEKHHAGREYAPSHFANHSSAFRLQVRSPYPDMRLFLSEGASRIRSSSASTPRRGGSHGATRRPMALHSGDRLGHLRGRRAGFGVPLRRDPPSGRDLDDGTVSQLLEECAGDCGRDTHYWAPPAQNRTGSFPAYGSHLGCLTAGLGLPYALRRR